MEFDGYTYRITEIGKRFLWVCDVLQIGPGFYMPQVYENIIYVLSNTGKFQDSSPSKRKC